MLNRESIKAHVVRHKKVYLIGSYVVYGGICILVTRRVCLNGVVTKASNRAGIIIGNQTVEIITVIKRFGPGHPGYPVMNALTKEWWASARACAKAEGISETMLSGNLNGKIPDVFGKTYSWVSFVPMPAIAE